MEEKENVLTYEPGNTDDLATETTTLKSGSSILARIIGEDEENE